MNEVVVLSEADIKERIFKNMDEYGEQSVLVQYAMFMGKAQMLELGLKRLMSRTFSIPIEKMEKWTLGKTKNELRDCGVRPDFIALLERVVDYRNSMAHEFLANTVITQMLADFSDRLLYGDLFKGLYELEQLIVLYDWCEENDGWMPTF
jgi:hypothetical protein